MRDDGLTCGDHGRSGGRSVTDVVGYGPWAAAEERWFRSCPQVVGIANPLTTLRTSSRAAADVPAANMLFSIALPEAGRAAKVLFDPAQSVQVAIGLTERLAGYPAELWLIVAGLLSLPLTRRRWHPPAALVAGEE